MCCSELNCQVRICKKCYDAHDAHDENTITYVDQPFDHIVEGNTIDKEDKEDGEIEYCQEVNPQEEVVNNDEVEDGTLQSNNDLFGDGDEYDGQDNTVDDNFLNNMEDVYPEKLTNSADNIDNDSIVQNNYNDF